MNNYSKNLFYIITFFLILVKVNYSQSYQVIQSDQNKIIIEFDFANSYSVTDTLIDNRLLQFISSKEFFYRKPGEPWIPDYIVNLGVPDGAEPTFKILDVENEVYKNKFIIPFPENDPLISKQDINQIDEMIYSSNLFFPSKEVALYEKYKYRFINILPVAISVFQFNPISRDLIFNRKIKIEIDYNYPNIMQNLNKVDVFTEDFVKQNLINADVAIDWILKENKVDSPNQNYWYNPNKRYFKLYLKAKGVYRITFDQLVTLGVQLGNGVPSKSLEIFNDGIEIPIEVVDGQDSVFNSGDYFQFVGYPPKPSPYCKLNIYNTSNVYWFSSESDSAGLRYLPQDGYPVSWIKTFQTNLQTLHFEKDSLYERLGYALNDNRDFWFWQKANSLNNTQQFGFEDIFKSFENWNTDSPYVNIKVDMHGITNNQYCPIDHKAYIEITGQPIGSISWDGQTQKTFEKKFYVSNDSVKIYPSGNILNVWVRGDECAYGDDEIRINWYEFDYWRNNRTNGDNYIFKSPPSTYNKTRFWLYNWLDDSIKVYVPLKNKIIKNLQFVNDQFNSVLFVDDVVQQMEYFCVGTNYYLSVDSIVAAQMSDYRNTVNGADYIIITHPLFSNIAERLKLFRENNFPDTSIVNPRIFIADIQKIYDEFSNGLMDPYAVKDFVKYCFDNWTAPAPSYVVLLGDMSYDYRKLLPSSRPNFIPSIPYFSTTYGIAASDNMFVAVSGTDVFPDLAIGRLSIETLEEGEVLLNKLENYPSDQGKQWKQKTLLIASGLSLEDEISFGFNDASVKLENDFILPNGYNTEKVFRYPSKPEQIPFQGEGPAIRDKFNNGVVLANYYGHGGGYQWDLVFTNDDIQLLQNSGRLPFVISVTCYTAHFDNQNVFGEQFNKALGKGSIGFFGSSGLTYWSIGKTINLQLFGQIFKRRNFIIGKAIMNAKNLVPGSGFYGTQIALLTNLSDPVLKLALPDKPDFTIKSSDINILPEYPIVGDTILVKALIDNIGPVFNPDSVTVELFISSADTSYQLESIKIGSFGERDSVFFRWIPEDGNAYQLTIKVNEIDVIPEMDHSDNSATAYFAVFNLSEPNIIHPIDGLASNSPNIKFVFVDGGFYINKELSYVIEIDTALSFSAPIINSGTLSAVEGVLRWNSPTLQPGSYFWRTRIYDGTNFGNWSGTRSINISDEVEKGFVAKAKTLKLFNSYNMLYSDLDSSLILNTSILPPRASKNTFIKDYDIQPPIPDSTKFTTICTDGSYIYYGTIWFYALNNNPNGYSYIYRIGTGYNGTEEGKYYGIFSSFYGKIYNSIFYHSDGHIYISQGNSHFLTRINVQNQEIDSIFIADGILNWEEGKIVNGYSYLKSDGNYIYNLASRDSSSSDNKYILRIFDTSSPNWTLIKSYQTLLSTPYAGYTDFFAAKGFIYPTEYLQSNYMRRIRETDGFYEEEWIIYQPFQSYYSWCYDWTNNNIYAGVFRASGYPSKISKFVAEYTDANGSVYSQSVGPAKKWNSIKYEIINNSIQAKSKVDLQGFSSITRVWEDISSDISQDFDLDTLSTNSYSYLRLFFSFSDSSLGASSPIKLKKVKINYDELPEVVINQSNINIFPDSVLQGLNIKLSVKIINLGYSSADSVRLRYYLNDADSTFFEPTLSILSDTSMIQEYDLNTNQLLFDNKIKVFGQSPIGEYNTINNIAQKIFYIARDSTNPLFNITFDGKEIINGDIISSEPEVVITLEDNSPLPLDSTYFTLVHTYNNIPKVLTVPGPDVTYNYTPYPNSRAVITWKPKLEDGRHVLEVLAKDASGNFFDSTSSRSVFNVFNNPDLLQVYNYPNPFSDNTYFTFELRGVLPPEEFKIKIFTVAGRLIREIIPTTPLQIGFNKIYWDGKDEDGDEIANGLYFYKIISKHNGEVKTTIQKLAKVK